MSIWFSMLLGFIQGITEFLPVSSSGHLAIFQNFFGMENVDTDYMFFDVLLHFSTLIAVFIFFWKDIKAMITEFFRLFNRKYNRSVRVPPARRMLFLIIMATLPLIIFVFFADAVEKLSLRPLFIGIALCGTGLLLWLSDKLPKGSKDEKTATMADAVFVGFMQGIATIPGLSRSGVTISTGLFRGFDRKFAMRFSFLMSIPAILGATVLKTKDAIETGIVWGEMPVYLIGMLVAGVVGYLALCLLRRLMDKGNFRVFSYYCLLVGVATILASFIVK